MHSPIPVGRDYLGTEYNCMHRVPGYRYPGYRYPGVPVPGMHTSVADFINACGYNCMHMHAYLGMHVWVCIHVPVWSTEYR